MKMIESEGRGAIWGVLKARRQAAIAVRMLMIAMMEIAIVMVLMTMKGVVRARMRPRVGVVMTRRTMKTTLRMRVVSGMLARVDL